MTFYDWNIMSWEDRQYIANKAGLNPPSTARRSWEQLSPEERQRIDLVLRERFRRGQRVPTLKQRPRLGPATQLVRDTVQAMKENNSGWSDRPAIRMYSNDIIDVYDRRGMYQRWELDRLNQDALVKKVMRALQELGWHR